jgi:hypothetical protein
MRFSLRPHATVGVALIGAGIALATAAPHPPEVRAVQLAGGDGDDVTLAIGGSGLPIPPQSYVDAVTDRYITPYFPGFTDDNAQALFTPEGLSPIYTGVKSLPLDESVDQGRQILDHAIHEQVDDNGNNLAVLGYSQSAVISSVELDDLADDGNPVDHDKLHFSLIGNPSSPNGGFLERFDGLNVPSLGIHATGATPPDTPYDVDIISQEYDGWTDFPQYPINLLADLNAFAGIRTVHGTYPDLTDDQLDKQFQMETSDGYDGNTSYYMIPHDSLPLTDLVREIPVVGKPMADLFEPALTQIVNLGYDNPDNEGWSTDPDVPTELGLFPSADQVSTAMDNLGPALAEGFDKFSDDLSDPSALFDDVGSDGPASSTADVASSPTDVVNALTAALSDAYALLLPTADVLTGIAFTIPNYDASLFFDHLDSPLDAIGLPVAADVGFLTMAAGVELMATLQQVDAISDDLADIGLG